MSREFQADAGLLLNTSSSSQYQYEPGFLLASNGAVSATGAGAPPTVTVSVPTATALAAGTGAGSPHVVTVSPPSGSGKVLAPGAPGYLPTVTVTPPTATTHHGGTGAGSPHVVTVSPPGGTAMSVSYGQGAPPVVTVSPPTAFAASPSDANFDAAFVIDVGLGVEVSAPGLIGSVALGSCPPCVIVCSDGTLLIASGFGPVKRMRQNERVLSNAGVPAPKTHPVIKSTLDQGGAAAPASTRTVRFDYSQYGATRSVWFGSFISSQARDLPLARAGLAARTADLERYLPLAVPLTGESEYARKLRVRNLFLGQVSVQPGDPTTIRWDWNYVAFDLLVYDESEVNGSPGVGVITGRYQAFMRYVDKDGIPSDPSPISPDSILAAEPYVQYDQLEIPDDPRVVRRQLWRNDNGQSDVFYLDIDTDDLTSTSLKSYQTDAQLRLGQDLPFEDNDLFSMIYLYAEPAEDKPFVAEHKSRVWYGGTVRYFEGHAEVTSGSATVAGVGTAWSSAMMGRQFVAGGREYLVLAVDADAQTLTLDVPYKGTTDTLAPYVIRSYRGEAYEVYCSGAGFPESLPVDNRFTLPQDNDAQTGWVVYNEDLYLLKTRHIYRVSCGPDPKRDASIQLAAERGCLSYRLAVPVGGVCLMLDRQGIHAFDGGPDPQNVSIQVGDLFRVESAWHRINWDADPCHWFGVHVEELGFVRFAVPMGSDTLPRHAVCYDYKRKRFWLEEYPVALTAGCVSSHPGILGRPLLGAEDGELLTSDFGPLDFLPDPANSRLGVAVAASAYRITCESLPPAGVENLPVAVVQGRGRGQRRRVVAVDGYDLVVDAPFLRLPDSTSALQIGAVPWMADSKEHDRQRSETETSQAVRFQFEPAAATLDMYVNVLQDGVEYAKNGSNETLGAVHYEKDLEPTAKRIDLTNQWGYARINFDKMQEQDVSRHALLVVEMEGFSGQVRPVLNEIKMIGAVS